MKVVPTSLNVLLILPVFGSRPIAASDFIKILHQLAVGTASHGEGNIATTSLARRIVWNRPTAGAHCVRLVRMRSDRAFFAIFTTIPSRWTGAEVDRTSLVTSEEVFFNGWRRWRTVDVHWEVVLWWWPTEVFVVVISSGSKDNSVVAKEGKVVILVGAVFWRFTEGEVVERRGDAQFIQFIERDLEFPYEIKLNVQRKTSQDIIYLSRYLGQRMTGP